jgi:hypothetical protein
MFVIKEGKGMMLFYPFYFDNSVLVCDKFSVTPYLGLE